MEGEMAPNPTVLKEQRCQKWAFMASPVQNTDRMTTNVSKRHCQIFWHWCLRVGASVMDSWSRL